MSKHQQAVHAAGHAVVAILLGMDLEHVRVFETGCGWAGDMNLIGKHGDVDDRDHVAILAAGSIAEFQVDRGYQSDPKVRYGSDDWLQIDALAKRHPETPAEDFMADAEERALALLGEPNNWRAVTVLADALMEKEEVQGFDALAIVRAVFSGGANVAKRRFNCQDGLCNL